MKILYVFALTSLMANAQTVLSFTPVDAQYSAALDRIIMVSASPNQLHIYNPITQSDTTVGLPTAPNAVSVSPDGLYAAVGHDGLVSYVNLSSAFIQQSYTIDTNAQAIALAEQWIYVLPSLVGPTYSIQISTGIVSTFGYSYQSNGRYNAAVSAIYEDTDGSYPEYLYQLNTSTGPISGSQTAPYFDTYSICGGIWYSTDGSLIFNGCGSVFHASANTAIDLRYAGSLSNQQSAGALSDSAAIGMLAAVPSTTFFSGNPGVVNLYDNTYFQNLGQFTLAGFTAGGNTLTPQGRWVFFNNAGSTLSVVMQGINSSNNVGGVAVQNFSMSAPSPCGAAFVSSTATASAAGSLATMGITASDTCIYKAVPNVSWLAAVSGAYGSGNQTLTYLVRPNTAATQRTGTISMGGQTLTVTQPGASAMAPFQPLAYNIVAATYDTAIDSIVFAASGPNELHLYNPATAADTVIPLPLAPLSVSVRPDGGFAAVGHDGWVTYVNLQTNTVQSTIPVTTDAASVILAENGYLYIFPAIDSSVYSLQPGASSPAITATPNFYGGPARLTPGYLTIYQIPGKWNIFDGALSPITLQNQAASCGNFWLTVDGQYVFTECGTVYTASENEAQDLLYHGTLSNAGAVAWAAESNPTQSTAVVPAFSYSQNSSDTQVQIYGDSYLGYAGTFSLPEFTAGGNSYPGHGKYLFWNNAGTALYAIEQADSSANLLSSFAVETIAASSYTGACAVTLGSQSANEQAGLGFDSVVITTGSNCVWTASSNASWLTITQGAFAFGSGSLEFSFSANSSSNSRSGTLTIAGQTFTVVQAGAIFTISGQITLYGQPLSGVTLHLTGGATTTTDGSGNYSFGSLGQAVTFTVTPELDGHIFSPSSFTVQNIEANQTANFACFLQYDFNGGSNPDVLWESPTSGWVQIWYLGGAQGVTIEKAANLTLSNPWHVVGVGDFNGDGSPDVVWQDPVKGAVQIWFLGGPLGNQFMSAVNITTSNPWRVVSVADFNQDGHPDLLWEDPVSGWAQIWYLGGPQGTTFLGAANLTLKNPWHIVGTGDFNLDGAPDVLWQDPVSGTVQIWYMGGTAAGAQGSVFQSAVNLTGAMTTKAVAIADFNQDGHPDVIFQDPVTGAATVYYYTGAQGTTANGTAVLSTGNPWYIAGPH